MPAKQPSRLSLESPFPTTVPGLDAILGGGLPVGDLLFIMGVPGTGKTVLSLQIAFGRIRSGGRVLFLTAFSESHDKLISHVAGFDFFDRTAIGQQLQMLSILPMLSEGAEETVRSLVRTARQKRIELVIIDGFRGIRDAFASDYAMRQFLQLLSTQLSYHGTTLVLTIETDGGEIGLQSALTTADSLLALSFERSGQQSHRLLEARKVRGQAPLLGIHRYRIDRAGVRVFPRVEAMPIETLPAVAAGRAPFNLPALDTMLRGGLTSSTATLVGGSPGTGKTLLAIQYLLAGAANGEHGLFVTLQETPEQLFDKARAFGLELEQAVAAGQIQVIRRPPVELDVDELADVIRRHVMEHQTHRLVFDGLNALQYAFARDGRGQNYLAALLELLGTRQVTSLFITEETRIVGYEPDNEAMPLYILSSNRLLLRHVEYRSRLRRIISIVKTRFSEHDAAIREFTIGPGGIEVGEPLADAEGLLTGVATVRPTQLLSVGESPQGA